MKKLSYLIVLVLILGLALTGCTLLSNIGQVPTNEQSGISYLTKHTEDAPQETTLFAGQNIPVGTVSVWNDCINLYVKYETTGGWVMTETHLAVVTDLADFPTNKPGNPKVGLFPYGEENIFTNTWEQTIKLEDLEAVAEQQLYIAAHAVVVDTNSTQIVSIVSNEGDTVYGPLYTATPIGSGDWEPSKEATEAINNITDSRWQWGLDPPRTGVDIPDALWISTASYTEDEGLAYSWRWFTEGLEVPKYPVPNSGILIINANNEYWAYLNGTFVGTDNWSFPPTGIETWPFDPIMGNNTFDFLVKNFPPEHPTNNPNGLTYKVTADYYDRIETAWAKGEPFTEQGNWATYFTYTVQLPQDGMVLWLDAGKGITATSGVSKWEDQSGSGNDAEQGDTDKQPTYETNGPNGKAVVRFDGSNDFLITENVSLGNSISVFAVVEAEDKMSPNDHDWRYNQGIVTQYKDGRYILEINSTAIRFQFYDGDWITADADATCWQLYGVIREDSFTKRLYLNGVEAASKNTSTGTSGSTNPIKIGFSGDYSRYLKGDIAEIFVYDRVLSDSERDMVQTYLNIKYAIY